MDAHRRLPVWQLARQLVKAVYELTRCLPREEQYVTIMQLRRAAWSVQNNIAEGNAKLGRGELRRYFGISIGSLAEIDSMVVTLPDLYEIDRPTAARVLELREAISKSLFAILRSRGR